MAKFILTITTDNAAFADDRGWEVARILRQVADKVGDQGEEGGRVVDANGNVVGEFGFAEE